MFVDDIGIKGGRDEYGGEKIEGNENIRRFIWEYAVGLERVLFRVEESGLTVKGQKLVAVTDEMEIVGQRVCFAGRKIAYGKLNKIKNFPNPLNVTELRGFLGICVYTMLGERFRSHRKTVTKFDKEGCGIHLDGRARGIVQET